LLNSVHPEKEEPMSDNIPKPEDQMMQWITSKWITKPIHVAIELGIADLLKDGPASIDTLAKKTELECVL
jgi:hypothetical protein